MKETDDSPIGRVRTAYGYTAALLIRTRLHSIYGMLKHKQDFDGQKFYRIPVPAA